MNIIKIALYSIFLCFLKEVINSVLCKEAMLESCPQLFGQGNCEPLL